MDILYFTKSKKYTCKALEYMIQRYNVVGLVCKTREILYHTEMEEICAENRIRIYDSDELYRELEEGVLPHIDLAISNTYGRLIRPSFIEYVHGNCINLHGAVLPDYRGPFPYNYGILNREREWGVTAHYVNERFDEGEIIRVGRFPIDPDRISVAELIEQTQKTAYELTIDLLESWERDGRPASYAQPAGGRYYSRADFEADKRVLATDSAQEVIQKIRAFWCPPYEGAYVEIDGVHFQLCLPEEKADDK